MKLRFLSWSVIVLLAACSSGKKAFERGDYYGAVEKAVHRLKQSPTNSKSLKTLQEAYPLAVEYFETQANNAIASNDEFKYKTAILSYNQANQMYELIKQCPGCMKVIKSPKNYYAEIGPLKEKAADESYNAGITSLMKGTREDAKRAYFNFRDAQSFVSGYKDVVEYLDKAKFEATLKVILEQVPVPTRYNLSGGFFQDKVQQYVHTTYTDQAFVKFFTPEEAKNVNLTTVDQVLHIQFDDFSIGNTTLKQNTETFTRDSVKVGETKVEGKIVPVYGTVKAKLVTYNKELLSTGLLSMVVTDAKTNGILNTKKFSGQYGWTNSWARFDGDERALTTAQLNLCNQKELQPPDAQAMFLEVTKPLYSQLTSAISGFYQAY